MVQCVPLYVQVLILVALAGFNFTAFAEETFQPTTPTEKPEECGVSKDSTLSASTEDGADTPLGGFPWHAGIYYRETTGEETWTYYCGGTLIKKGVILTAAQCITTLNGEKQNATDIGVALGKHYSSWNHSEDTAIKRYVSRVIVLPGYRGYNNKFALDIGLLVLSEPVAVTSFVMPVCLDYSAPYLLAANRTGFVASWDRTPNSQTVDDVRLHTNVYNIIDIERCIESMKRSHGFIGFDKFCALKPSGEVAGKGEGGGGITVISNGLHYIVGIVSVRYLESITLFTNITWNVHMHFLKNELVNY